MLILLDVGEDVDLIDRALLQFLVFFEATHLDHLHRVLLVIVFVGRTEHLAVGALADYLVEGVVLYYPHHSINPYNQEGGTSYRSWVERQGKVRMATSAGFLGFLGMAETAFGLGLGSKVE